MNFVFIMTDTQNRNMVGAYGNPQVDTLNLDRLAKSGIRFERAYTTSPLCTPARSAIFSGTHPTVNGAWCNNVPIYETIPLMGTMFSYFGYRTAYTGKWHLDGSGYFGDGIPRGGFEKDWWYDGKCYAEEIGDTLFQKYLTSQTPDELRDAGFQENNIWGHRVADRAIDFLQTVGNTPFVLAVSFDEPHAPYITPPDYWESFDVNHIPKRPNFGATVAEKTHLQQVHNQESPVDPGAWDRFRKTLQKHYACNAYIDREIGRVVDMVDTLHKDNTVIIYTSDHGDMQGSHGLHSKGPMMYEEITNIPLIIRMPGGLQAKSTSALVSHLDIIPTMLDLIGIVPPCSLQGVSLKPLLDNSTPSVRTTTMISFTRYAINHDDWGGFYPIRCLTDGHYKLVINLLDQDEFYDLDNDPYEQINGIHDTQYETIRNEFHDQLLEEMDRIRDPFRSPQWGRREWRTVRKLFYHGGQRRNHPQGFPFQSVGLEADGTSSS